MLWTKYFTSSKIIHDLIRIHGKDQFFFEIRKTFKSAKETLAWEERVIDKIIANPKCLNRHSIKGLGFYGKSPHFTPEHKAKISKAKTGARLSQETKNKLSRINTGKHHTNLSKQLIGKAAKGIPKSQVCKDKIGKANKGRVFTRIQCQHCNKNISSNRVSVHQKSCHQTTIPF